MYESPFVVVEWPGKTMLLQTGHYHTIVPTAEKNHFKFDIEVEKGDPKCRSCLSL